MSVTPRQTGTVLDEIIAGVLTDLRGRQELVEEAGLREAAELIDPPLDPQRALRADGLSVIAEVKRASPSKGHLAEIRDPSVLAGNYQAGGATAISVLTEARRFNGSLADLDAVRAGVGIPVLRKDFIVTEYQVLEARAHGADLVLLIVAALDDAELETLYRLIRRLGMTALVEVHNAEEARRAAHLGASVIGVNARNLKTLDVDTGIFAELLPQLPEQTVKIAESGILTLDDALAAHRAGADAILVGEALVRSGDPAAFIASIREATSS
ncbi:indole-3-glycerol phosphate synthase TrpC [Acidipropionibacterium virtanenii]|uniref:Indole-3-glycerol phosphate synthase n=1 Tax=Acidipropionibacterium virtanenii TaxID=2057246 RepID=A0A344UU05_9ACTN|nr:indole-3-glycerol phosphate synthase TrpC [Acidipropionibacterium virtanenii]AXE38753.1 Indole-3-glycerol phosphate synthase [Acidipropionibacterium virtanenii]